jgi:ribose transport system permease protein
MSTVTTANEPKTNLPPDRRNGRRLALVIVSKYGTLMAMAIMIAIFAIAAPNGAFLTVNNLVNIVNQSTLTAIIACGLTIVLIVGEFDLSIGYNASLAGILVTGFVANQGFALPLAIIATIFFGGVAGAANGILVTKARVNAVVATLGVGTILIGLEYGYTSGTPITKVPAGFASLALGKTLGVPNPIWFMAITLVILWVLLNRTPLGQRIQAVGANKSAARLAGIQVDRAKMSGFIIAGICASITGILLASLLGSGTPTAADGYLLDSFAAVYLGSATLRDGSFHIVGTLVGVLIVSVGFNGLSLLGTPTFWQYVFQGGILVFAVAVSSIARRYSRA